jgi:hypothetical protein
MWIISHRGNLNGPEPAEENKPERILKVLTMGIECEIDLWVVFENRSATSPEGVFEKGQKKLMLGHDAPQYEVADSFLGMHRLWIHCKNREALEYMASRKGKAHYFWHQSDDYTLTSMGIIWTYVGKPVPPGGICVLPEKQSSGIPSTVLGICTDYPLLYAKNDGTA